MKLSEIIGASSLTEGTAKGSEGLNVVSQNVEDAIALLNKHCKQALWMLDEDRPIYRGENHIAVTVDKTGFALVDTLLSKRVSENTSNFYTLIFDNHPGRTRFPKRSQSLICSTDKSKADEYGKSLIVIPFDGTKIGIVNRTDMWDTPMTFLGNRRSLNNLNRIFSYLELDEFDWNSIVEFDKKLKAGDQGALEQLEAVSQEFGFTTDEIKTKFLESILDAYSAKRTGHTAATTATMSHKISSEVWVGGKVMLIQPEMWQALLKARN